MAAAASALEMPAAPMTVPVATMAVVMARAIMEALSMRPAIVVVCFLIVLPIIQFLAW